MKKKGANLPNREQERVEDEYHRRSPEDFDELMSTATHHSPAAVHLPQRLVEDLRKFAEQQGDADFRKMVKTWIEERLRKEANATR